MNTQQLQCFLYVAEKLNFTKAAEALYLSVPTVTHHIKKLEEELGTKLFFRSSRVVKLTENGTLFYQDAREILNKMEKSMQHIAMEDKKKLVTFRIGCISGQEMEKFGPLFQKMRKEFSNIRPRVIVNDFFSVKNLLENRQMDLVLSTKGISNQCHFRKITTYQSYAVMEKTHPLVKKKTINFEELSDSTLITLPPKCVPFENGNKLQEWITLHIQDHLHIVAESEQESVLLAKSGYGVAIMPEFYLGKKPEDVAVIPIDETKTMDYGFSWFENEEHILWFMKQYKEKYKGATQES